jgi:foldase protein PrsA
LSFEFLSIIFIKMKKLKVDLKSISKGVCKKCSFVKTKKFKTVLGVVVGVVVLGFIIKTVFLAAFVNGRPISRITLIKNLEKQYGTTALSTLVEKSLIYQEAKKQKVSVSKDEIQNEITAIEEILKAQNITLDQALEARGQTRQELEEQIKVSKILEVILADKITVTDKEIADYFTTNKNYFDKGTLLENVKDDIKSELVQQKLADEYTTWIAGIKEKAKVFYLLKF